MKMGWKAMTRWVALGICAGIFCLAGAETASAQRIFQSYTKPQALPEFSLTDLQGKRVDSRDFRGQVVFLNFWATW